MTPNFELNENFTQCVGIDMAKAKFTACLTMTTGTDQICSTSVVEFPNTKTGFNQLLKWANKEAVKAYPCRFLMEPTGIYHEPLAYHLHKLGKQVFVILGNRAKAFAKYKGIRTKTDEMDCQLLAQIGCLEPSSNTWNPPATIYRELRTMCRFRKNIEHQLSMLNNHMEALTYSESAEDFVVKSCKSLIKSFERKLEDFDKKIEEKIKSDTELTERVKKVLTIPGVGMTTVVTILAETNGFEFFRSRKQLAKYVGLDVIEDKSGTIEHKDKLSKKGNTHIRACLYMPALVCISHNAPLREDYERIVARHPNQKKIAIVAIMRKLLLLVYTIWKSGEVWDETYHTPTENKRG